MSEPEPAPGPHQLPRLVAFLDEVSRDERREDGRDLTAEWDRALAHIPFPPAASENASRVLDGYLEKVLGPEAARRHVPFSANRHRVEEEDPLDVQAMMDRALRDADATPKEGA